MGKVKCIACSRSCKGQAIRLQDRYFHVKCFKCQACGKALATGGFYTKDNSHYCIDDYRRLFGVRCFVCDKYVEGDVVTALERTYHEDCFRCTACRRRFEPGDKVTHIAKNYLCTECCKDVSSSPEVVPKPGSVSMPVTPARHDASTNDPLNNGYVSSPALDSTLKNQKGNVLNGTDGRYLRNRVSAIGNTSGYKSDGSFERNLSRSTDFSDDNVFVDDRRGRQVFSPIQNIMRYRSVSPGGTSQISRKSKESSTGSQFDFDYRKFYQKSYLDIRGMFKRGPSMNPTNSQGPKHFHRPPSEDFSYSKTRKDIRIKGKTPWKSESKIEKQYKETIREQQPYKPMKNQEPIRFAKVPDAKSAEGSVQPIDRDDWPCPPHPAAAYPELLRGRPTNALINGETTRASNAKMDRDIDELEKMKKSGAAQMILNGLKKKKSTGNSLDPRSSSRTPSASSEPPYRTRYDSSVFASPSRDLDLRERVKSSLDCPVIDRRYRTTPLPSTSYHSDADASMIPRQNIVRYTEAPRPGYALRKPMRPVSTVGDSRLGYSFDGFESRTPSCRPQSSIDMLRRSSVYDSYDASVDLYDPMTGLKRSSRDRTPAASSATVSIGQPPASWSSPHSVRRSFHNLSRNSDDTAMLKVYPYERLRQPDKGESKLPAGVSRDALERHLAKEEFRAVFSMTVEEFSRLAEWKRNDLKKRHNLC